MNHFWIYFGSAWLIIGLITTIYGCMTAKVMNDTLLQDDIETIISYFTESDRTKQLREMYVQRHDPLVMAIKRERDEWLESKK